MKNPNLIERHLLTNKVDADLDVLRAAMLNRVTCHVNSTDVITKDNGRGREGTLKLEKKLSKPAALGDDMSHSMVLSLDTGAGHRGLPIGGLGHQVVAEIDTVAKVERRVSGQPAQSASEYAVREVVSVKWSCRPRSRVPQM
jgi:hypothetical protein